MLGIWAKFILLLKSVFVPKSLLWDALWCELPLPHSGIKTKQAQKG